MQSIINIITDVTGVTESDIISKDRTRRVTEARFVLSAMLHKYTSLTLDRIGKVSNRDHSTSVYHLKQYKLLYEVDVCFRTAAIDVDELIDLPVNRPL